MHEVIKHEMLSLQQDSGREILQACIHGSWDFVRQSVSLVFLKTGHNGSIIGRLLSIIGTF